MQPPSAFSPKPFWPTCTKAQLLQLFRRCISSVLSFSLPITTSLLFHPLSITPTLSFRCFVVKSKDERHQQRRVKLTHFDSRLYPFHPFIAVQTIHIPPTFAITIPHQRDKEFILSLFLRNNQSPRFDYLCTICPQLSAHRLCLAISTAGEHLVGTHSRYASSPNTGR